MKAFRYLLPMAVLAVLALTGLIDLSTLPWEDPDFRVSLAVVIVYLLWSVSGNREEGADRAGLYAVLLVSTVDSFLLRVSVFQGLYPLRWAGVAVLCAGSVIRVARRSDLGLLRAGRIMQMTGLSLGLGSLIGMGVAAFPGLILALKEEFPE